MSVQVTAARPVEARVAVRGKPGTEGLLEIADHKGRMRYYRYLQDAGTPTTFALLSLSSGERYDVDLGADAEAPCDCKDATFRPHRPCKHHIVCGRLLVGDL